MILTVGESCLIVLFFKLFLDNDGGGRLSAEGPRHPFSSRDVSNRLSIRESGIVGGGIQD